MGIIYICKFLWCKYILRDESKRRKALQQMNMKLIVKQNKTLLERCARNPISTKINDGPVWFFWWQGKEQMPEIVQICYKRLIDAVGNKREVIFLDKENIKNYVDLPDYVYWKAENGMMIMAHFSDVLRVSLLAEHGGLWIDSTVFVNGALPDFIFDHTYFSCKTPFAEKFISRCCFTCFLLGAAAGAPWIIYVRDALLNYWKKAECAFDYQLLDYMLISALDYVPAMKNEVDKGIMSAPHIHVFDQVRNSVCCPESYDKFMSECCFYKMSYKLDNRTHTEDGKLTYYGHMLKALNS